MQQEGFDVDECKRKLDAWQKRVVDDGIYPQMQTIVARNGEIVFSGSYGNRRDDAPLGDDTIFRIYSMTKPIVSVALMQLVEQGKAKLTDPLSKFIPDFDNMTILVQSPSGDCTPKNYSTIPATQPITVRDVLAHTSGFTYGIDKLGQILLLDGIYNTSSILEGMGPLGCYGHSCTLESFVNELAKQPLLFEPGTAWHYGHSYAVVGRLVEVLSGLSLANYLENMIFKPLDMVDTGFTVPPSKRDRFVALHAAGGPGKPLEDITSVYPDRHDESSDASMLQDGGGGLVSTAADYFAFSQCLLQGGVSKEGVRIVESRTLDLMTSNHLPRGGCLTDVVADTAFSWIAKSESCDNRSAYGLGFAIALDRHTFEGKLGVSPGTFSWVGVAKTIFWIDPVENIVVVSMTNVMNAGHYRKDLVDIVYGCVAERTRVKTH
jgi:CubicO group peptidase (beta-lactamase class C family)